jgi:hypothetical protein
MCIKVGDYIEGYEIIGVEERPSKTRIVVSKITRDDRFGTIYEGQADDKYHGARGTMIYAGLGSVVKIAGKKPLSTECWKPESRHRKVTVGQMYKHFKGNIYEVMAIAKDSETLSEKVVYRNITTDEVWVRDKEDFLSTVDKEKYPSIKQEFKFEET